MDLDVLERYLKVRERARHPGTPPHEAETARGMCAKMEAKHPWLAEAVRQRDRQAAGPGGFDGGSAPGGGFTGKPPGSGGFGGFNPWDLLNNLGAASGSEAFRTAANAAAAAAGAAAGSYAAGTVPDNIKADVARACVIEIKESPAEDTNRRGVKWGAKFAEDSVVLTLKIPTNALDRLTDRYGLDTVARALGALVEADLLDTLYDEDDGD